MTWQSLGSLALPHELQARGLRLRNDLQRLSHEVTTGRVAEPQHHLKGNLAPLAAVEHRLTRIENAAQGLAQRQTRLDAFENTLNLFVDQADEIATKLRMPFNPGAMTNSPELADGGARSALSGFTAALNQNVAGQALFAGTHVDRPALPGGDAILAAVEAATAGLGTADDIIAALEDFFMDDGGGFMTTLYQGGPPVPGGAAPSGAAQRALPTAGDPQVRQALMALSVAGILSGPSAPQDPDERRALELGAASAIGNARGKMVALVGSLGFEQAETTREQTRLASEKDALALTRESMIGADPYAAATRLEQARGQLESLYMVTARLSRLSLTEFLR